MKEKLKEIYGKIFFMLFRIFPLQNKVVFSSYWGKNFNDNPKYISDELLKTNKEIKQVWLNNSEKHFDADSNIKVVKWGTLKMIYEMATAKVWVDNHTKPAWILKRKKQFYIETWHGGLGMKKVEADMGDNLSKEAKKQIIHNSTIADLFISNSEFLTNVYRNAFWYNGKILECGFPRNDIFFENENIKKEIKNKVLNYFNIENNKKIALYAPTFRTNENVDVYNIDFEKLRNTLQSKFKSEFKILIRLHPRARHLSKKIVNFDENIMDASLYDDMQELIIASDIFITDYSSGIFDFALTGKAGFLYAKDIEEYKKERGLYYDLEILPFPLAKNNLELQDNINEFDEIVYKQKLKEFFKTEGIGLKENGVATKTIKEIIINFIEKGYIGEDCL